MGLVFYGCTYVLLIDIDDFADLNNDIKLTCKVKAASSERNRVFWELHYVDNAKVSPYYNHPDVEFGIPNPHSGEYPIQGYNDTIEFCFDISSALDEDPGRYFLSYFNTFDDPSEDSLYIIDYTIIDQRFGETFELTSGVNDYIIYEHPCFPSTNFYINYDLIPFTIDSNTLLFSDMVSRFQPTVTNNATLTVDDSVNIDFYNSSIIINNGSSMPVANHVYFNAKEGYCEVDISGYMETGNEFHTSVDLLVKNGGTLKIKNNTAFYLEDNAVITVEEGGTLIIEDNASIKGRNSSNKIVVNGTLQPGNNLSFEPVFYMEFWEGLELNTPNASCNLGSPSFTNCGISGDCKTLTLSSASFNKGNVFITAENTAISNSTFNNGFISIDHPGGRPSTGINISGCSISNVNDDDARGAILINGHPEFVISNNTVTNNACDGIALYRSGSEKGDHRITGNTISGNTGEYNVAGIRIYQSYAEITGNNIITNNENGIICLNNSNIRIEGFAEAQKVSETQQVMNNEENQVHASSNSFPVYFRYNAVIDEDNTMPLVYYRAQEEEHVDVAYNFWGNNFAPEEDFYPAELFDYEPVWELEYLQENPGPAEMLYADATQEMQTGNYNQAETKYKQVVQQYPASKFSKSALKVMLLLEELNNNNYNQLQNYYSNPQLQNNDVLKKLASRLSNNCDIKMENYPNAIAWFEDVIQDPETLEDSVFAIIDLENLYLMMEESGKSSYQGKMVEFIPESREAHHKHRAELLSLLGGEQTNAITAGPAERDVNATQLVTLEPNPFTNNTTINCQISKPAYVNISIYSLTGQKVLDVADGYKEKGQYRFQVSAKHLPEGIYVYSLQMDGTIKERGKVVLVK